MIYKAYGVLDVFAGDHLHRCVHVFEGEGYKSRCCSYPSKCKRICICASG